MRYYVAAIALSFVWALNAYAMKARVTNEQLDWSTVAASAALAVCWPVSVLILIANIVVWIRSKGTRFMAI